MHLRSLSGHGRGPNHSTSPSSYLSSPRINCLLKLPRSPPSLLLGQQCRSGRSLCLPPLVKVGNTKTNSGDRLHCTAAQHTSYKNSNPQCRFGPKLKSPQNTNIFSNLAGTAGGRIYAAWKPIASITHGRCFRGQTPRCPLWIVFPASPEFCIFPQKPPLPHPYTLSVGNA